MACDLQRGSLSRDILPKPALRSSETGPCGRSRRDKDGHSQTTSARAPPARRVLSRFPAERIKRASHHVPPPNEAAHIATFANKPHHCGNRQEPGEQ